ARQVLPALPGESKDLRFWPFGGWHNARENRVYLFYGRVRVTGGGPLSFREEGYGLAQAAIRPPVWADSGNPASLRFSRVNAQPGQELWWTPADGKPVFGCAVVAGGLGGYIYVVGVQERGRRKFGKLARAPRDRAGDLQAYEYFAGASRWSRNIEEAADVEG